MESTLVGMAQYPTDIPDSVACLVIDELCVLAMLLLAGRPEANVQWCPVAMLGEVTRPRRGDAARAQRAETPRLPGVSGVRGR